MWPWINHLIFQRVGVLVYKMGVMMQLTHGAISKPDETTYVKCQAHKRLSDTYFHSLSPPLLSSIWEPERTKLSKQVLPRGSQRVETCDFVGGILVISVLYGRMFSGVRLALSLWWQLIQVVQDFFLNRLTPLSMKNFC